jgi:outer membrane protein OmpA-like peptidoglycan-associated protein
MMKSTKFNALSAILLTGALSFPALAQTSATQTAPSTDPAAASTPQQNGADSSTYATGKPLEQQSKEGFWGHVNPLARKKWVRRQLDPIRDRTNELDQLQSKNRNDIHDVDTRATAGISKANAAAALADQHAQDAANRANSANGVATDASNRTTTLNGTVQNLDQYQQVSAVTVPFPAGHLTLGKTAKSDLDDVATKLGTEKGYLIEVQGYSRSGVKASQDMADAVVRYLVTEHQVPIFRIYKSGLGKQTAAAATATDPDAKPIRNGVRVTLLHNSLASMGAGATASNSTPSSTAGAPSGTSNPPANQ